MQPPYSGMKIIHDQQIQDALEHHHHYAGQETHRHGLLRTFGKALARFSTQLRSETRTAPPCRCSVNVIPCCSKCGETHP